MICPVRVVPKQSNPRSARVKGDRHWASKSKHLMDAQLPAKPTHSVTNGDARWSRLLMTMMMQVPAKLHEPLAACSH